MTTAQNNQLLLFDVSTTQNTLPDANLCPVEICAEKLNLDDLLNKKGDGEQIHFFIVPDEKIMPAAEIQMEKAANEIDGEVWLDEGLRKVYDILRVIRFNPGPCLLGYNLPYDIESVSHNMKRIFKDKDDNLANFGEVLESADKLDVMILAKKIIPPTKVGTYTMLNVAVYMYGLKVLERLKTMTGSVRDNYLCKVILVGLIKLGQKMFPAHDFSSVQGILKFLAEPQKLEVFPFGKYMNQKISDIAKKDHGYIEWLLKDAENLKKSNPDVYFTLTTLD